MALYGMANNNVIIPAERDGALYNFLLGGQDYVFDGIGDEFAITPSSSSFLLTLGNGEGVVCGRHVTEAESGGSNSMIQLEANSSGYVVIRVDLSRPAGTEAYLYATPALSSEDLNNNGTVHDLPLYQYQTDASGVSSFTDVRNISAGSNVVCELSGGALYVYYYEDGVVTRKQVGSLDPATLTATPADVKSGKTFGGANSDEPLTGTFAGQGKTVTAGTTNKTVYPDTGKYLTAVTVAPTPTVSKTVSPTTSQQTVTPDSGKYLSSVTVNAITGSWSQVYKNSTSNGSSMTYTTTMAYKALLVCWNNSVNVTITGNQPTYSSGIKNDIYIGNSPKFYWLIGVPSGCVITHPTYDASVGNGFLNIFSLLG